MMDRFHCDRCRKCMGSEEAQNQPKRIIPDYFCKKCETHMTDPINPNLVNNKKLYVDFEEF
jgi:hypothetical protein